MSPTTRSILTAVEAHYKDPSISYPDEGNQIMFELTPYLESAGINDPFSKVSFQAAYSVRLDR